MGNNCDFHSINDEIIDEKELGDASSAINLSASQ